MSDINTSKVDGNTVSASEFNQLAEIDNLISTSGQTPSTANLEQQAIASARYSSAGNFFTDSGTANAYVLSPVSPFKSPVSSTAGEGYYNGMVIRFRAGNACSGASTVNVNNAGSKSLVKSDGSTALTTGDIPANTEVEFVYNGTNFVQSIGKVPATTTTQGIAFLSKDILISNNVGTPNSKIDFSDGVMIFDDGSGAINSSAMTGDLANLFATSDGMLDTGTKANTSDYSLFAVYNPTTGVIKPLASLSRTAPTMPSGFTKKEYRGKILTDASGNIISFKQYKDKFEITATFPFKAFPANTTTYTDISFATNYAKEVDQIINSYLSSTLGTGFTSLLYLKSKNYTDGSLIAVGETNSASVVLKIGQNVSIVSDSSGIWQYKTSSTSSFVVSTGLGFYLKGWNDINLKIRG